MKTRFYIVNDKTGKKHGWCLTLEFAKKCCGVGEHIVHVTR
jgi:hypothetical protein